MQKNNQLTKKTQLIIMEVLVLSQFERDATKEEQNIFVYINLDQLTQTCTLTANIHPIES